MKNFFLHCSAFLFCGVLGFFSAGAIYFPIVEDYWLRVVLTLGGMAIVYGGESIIKLGQVRACTSSGFSGPHCIDYNLLIPALVLWACFFAFWLWRQVQKSPDARPYVYVKPSIATTAATAWFFKISKPPKLLAAVVALFVFIVALKIRPLPKQLGFYNHESYGLLALLTISFACALYWLSSIKRIGTSMRLTLHVTISGALGFLATGVIYQFLSIVKALHEAGNTSISFINGFSRFVARLFTSGLNDMVPLGRAASCVQWESVLFGSACNETSSYTPMFLLWLACFLYLRWRLETRLSSIQLANKALH